MVGEEKATQHIKEKEARNDTKGDKRVTKKQGKKKHYTGIQTQQTKKTNCTHTCELPEQRNSQDFNQNVPKLFAITSHRVGHRAQVTACYVRVTTHAPSRVMACGHVKSGFTIHPMMSWAF